MTAARLAGVAWWGGWGEAEGLTKPDLTRPTTRQLPRDVRRCGTEFDAEEKDHRPDFIERLVVGIFGKKVLDDPEPMGMKRMQYEDFPEVYPATTTEFAAPVEGDDEEVAAFRPLLARTQLEEKELMLCYSAEECGWDPDAFHRSVDSMGAAVRALLPLRATAGARESRRTTVQSS